MPSTARRLRDNPKWTDLSAYQRKFSNRYPRYERTYPQIERSIKVYAARGTLTLANSKRFGQCVDLLRPIIAVKNYKSQTPFPEDPQEIRRLVSCVVRLKRCPIGKDELHGEPAVLFSEVIELEGFRLPTVSAIFHFCHPRNFPIVDRNIEAACRILKRRYPETFTDVEQPRLPSGKKKAIGHTSLNRYRAFIAFLKRVRAVQQKRHGGNPDFHFIDQALMVLGAESY
jgi:hypothetical protein